MEIIKELRLELGVKQSYLAQELGLNQGNYSKLENGNLFQNNMSEIEAKAIKILKPMLIKKLISAQSEVERLESLIIQYK